MLVAVAANAQMQPAATCSSTVKMTSDTEGVLTITIAPSSGWHIYGRDIPKGGPKPLKFDFSDSEGVTFVGAPTESASPERHHDSSFDMDLTYWSRPVTFTQKFKVAGSNSSTIKGFVQYQGCNDETCAPPKKFKFSHTIK